MFVIKQSEWKYLGNLKAHFLLIFPLLDSFLVGMAWGILERDLKSVNKIVSLVHERDMQQTELVYHIVWRKVYLLKLRVLSVAYLQATSSPENSWQRTWTSPVVLTSSDISSLNKSKGCALLINWGWWITSSDHCSDWKDSTFFHGLWLSCLQWTNEDGVNIQSHLLC